MPRTTIFPSTGSRLLTTSDCNRREAALSEEFFLVGAAVQIPDVLADPEYAYSDMQKAAGYRTHGGIGFGRAHQLLPGAETSQIGGHAVHSCLSIRNGMMKLF